MNSKISQNNKINNTDLNNYTSSSRINNKHISYAAAVTNTSSSTCLSTLTNNLKALLVTTPQGHPDSAATSMFLANKHKYLGEPLHHEFGTEYIRNDLGNGERSKRRYPDSTNYCPSCGYDIKPTHTPGTCTNRKACHNEQQHSLTRWEVSLPTATLSLDEVGR